MPGFPCRGEGSLSNPGDVSVTAPEVADLIWINLNSGFLIQNQDGTGNYPNMRRDEREVRAAREEWSWWSAICFP